jgi:multidrug efflux pump subunit AcrA (membrane-fusion protein)
MATTSIHSTGTGDPATAALERLRWAERRRSTAATEARQARERLAAAEEQLRQARQALRQARALAPIGDAEQMLGMGFFADELAFERAA